MLQLDCHAIATELQAMEAQRRMAERERKMRYRLRWPAICLK